jgi:hypothetical protein
MKRCPVCGADLAMAAALRRARKLKTARRWQRQNRERYNAYQAAYQRRLRARKREAVV